MTAPSSDPAAEMPLRMPCLADLPRRSKPGIVGDQSGAVLVVVVLALVVMLGSVGLAVDIGRGYLEKQRLSRAVDAGALAAARTLREGEAAARTEAETVARANRVANGVGNASTSLAFGTNERGENTVMFSATRSVPTLFMSVLRINQMTIRSQALAAVPPLDVVLVLDTSGSLGSVGAFDDLQTAAKAFVNRFDEDIDQMGLVSFSLIGVNRVMLRASGFKAAINNAINSLVSEWDTNPQEGLRLARQQITGVNARPAAAKAVVFFTDGIPTAYRAPIGAQERLIAVFTPSPSGSPGLTNIRGYFNNVNSPNPSSPNGCNNVTSCSVGGVTLTRQMVRNNAASRGLDQADQLRAAGVLVYSIGLGNPSAANPEAQPNLTYLRAIANEDGVEDAGQPQGKAYFAPTASDLDAVFNEVARDLIVRLAG